MHPGRRDNEPRKRREEALMNRLYIILTLETDQSELRMLNFDLMMRWPGWAVGRFGGKAPCGADVTAVTPA